jgi:hypothetical protein
VPPNRIPLSFALYGQMGFNTHTFNDTGQIEALRHLTFIVRDALKFVRAQAELTAKGPLNPASETEA